MRMRLRMAGRDYTALSCHLLPDDGKEAVALALCGTASTEDSTVMTVHKVIEIPYSLCERTEDMIKWPGDIAADLLNEAARKGFRLLKIHSHPNYYPHFSDTDDASDFELFRTAADRLDTDWPGISAILFPDGSIKARAVDGEGYFHPVESVLVAGSDIHLWHTEEESNPLPAYTERIAQTFGSGTTKLLSKLSIGIVGVSGTGSPLTELLYRSGVGELVLVDGDIIEEKNLNRIFNSTMNHAHEQTPKVIVAEDAILRSGLPTRAIPLNASLFEPEVVRRLAQCDIIFGCMDAHEGRALLNALCSFYCIPYFDLGVGLTADGKGSIRQASGNVHYLQPGGSSLLSRRVITQEKIAAESMKRVSPGEYERRRGEGYLVGVNEGSPAVITINTLIASLAANDFLARIHPYRSDDNDSFAYWSFDLVNSRLIADTPDGEPDMYLDQKVGRGDMVPLLNMPSLAERTRTQ